MFVTMLCRVRSRWGARHDADLQTRSVNALHNDRPAARRRRDARVRVGAVRKDDRVSAETIMFPTPRWKGRLCAAIRGWNL
jgi:hypothetical protein